MRITFACVSKRGLTQNFSFENKFDFHENERAGETFSYEWFRAKTRSVTEPNDFSETPSKTAYFLLIRKTI